MKFKIITTVSGKSLEDIQPELRMFYMLSDGRLSKLARDINTGRLSGRKAGSLNRVIKQIINENKDLVMQDHRLIKFLIKCNMSKWSRSELHLNIQQLFLIIAYRRLPQLEASLSQIIAHKKRENHGYVSVYFNINSQDFLANLDLNKFTEPHAIKYNGPLVWDKVRIEPGSDGRFWISFYPSQDYPDPIGKVSSDKLLIIFKQGQPPVIDKKYAFAVFKRMNNTPKHKPIYLLSLLSQLAVKESIRDGYENKSKYASEVLKIFSEIIGLWIGIGNCSSEEISFLK